jgi:hypothetical protein
MLPVRLLILFCLCVGVTACDKPPLPDDKAAVHAQVDAAPASQIDVQAPLDVSAVDAAQACTLDNVYGDCVSAEPCDLPVKSGVLSDVQHRQPERGLTSARLGLTACTQSSCTSAATALHIDPCRGTIG